MRSNRAIKRAISPCNGGICLPTSTSCEQNSLCNEAFEVGNPNFKLEKAVSVEAVLRGGGPGYTLEASAYHTWF